MDIVTEEISLILELVCLRYTFQKWTDLRFPDSGKLKLCSMLYQELTRIYKDLEKVFNTRNDP